MGGTAGAGCARRLSAALLGCALATTACSGSAGTGTTGGAARITAPPATEPYLVMAGPEAGWAVWPSGDAWALLQTDDGFRHLRNATPPGVATDGGLVLSRADTTLAVAVGTVERLVRSPLLTKTGAGQWEPGELPGGVVASRTAVALRPAGVSVLTTGRGGTLLTREAAGWRKVVDAGDLPDAVGLQLDGVTWAGDTLGWITGHRSSRGPVAFQTGDGGRTWTAVRGPRTSAVASLAPCGLGTDWALPELDASGALRVLHTRDAGGTWTAGQTVPASSGRPVWGCGGGEIWAVGTGAGSRIHASSDGGATWTATGPAPAGLTALVPTGPTDGYAVRGGPSPALWRVTGAGRTFIRVDLPAWVGTLGAGTGGD